jgi:hypothetical protein
VILAAQLIAIHRERQAGLAAVCAHARHRERLVHCTQALVEQRVLAEFGGAMRALVVFDDTLGRVAQLGAEGYCC